MLKEKTTRIVDEIAPAVGANNETIGIQAIYDPIVGKHLLAGIKDVMGEAATDEIIRHEFLGSAQALEVA